MYGLIPKKYNHEPELEIQKLQFDTKSQLDPYLVFWSWKSKVIQKLTISLEVGPDTKNCRCRSNVSFV